MSLINPLIGSNLATAAPFDTTLIGNSIWVDGSGTSGDAMTRTWGTESNQDRWIWATWYNPLRVIDAAADINNIFASGSAANGFYLRHNSTNSTFVIFCRDNTGKEGAINTSESYRDVGSWYHVLVDFDSANATANDRISLYVNGVRVGAYSGTNIGQNNHINTNVSGQTAKIAQDLSTTPNYHVQGYLAQTVFLDNKSIANGDLAITDFLDTFTFGTNGSQIVPKSNTDIIALASAAGNNSFCLDYSDSSNIVNDASSKGNNFTPTGGGSPTITSANQSTSTPSKTYSVFNPIAKRSSAFTLSNGNRTTVTPTFDQWMKTTIPFVMSGSNIIRTQFTFSTLGDGLCGITGSPHTSGTYYTSAAAGRGEVALLGNGALSVDGSFNNTYTSALSNGDIVDVIVNLDVGAVYFAVNGTLLGGATESEIQAGTTTNAAQTGGSFVRRVAGEVFNYYVGQYNPSAATIVYNSGQTAFTHSYSSITSLKSLNTADLPAPDYQGIDYFNAVKYTGDGTAIGSGGKAVTGTGFKPDWVWIKNRDAADSHILTDVVRGVTKYISSNSTAVEATNTEALSTFDTDGFTVGNLDAVNTNTENYVSWNWLAGGTGSSNTNGSINSTVTVANAGHLSIGTYVGSGANATIGHGLGGVPEMIIVKNRDQTDDWPVYHVGTASDPETDVLYLNLTLAVQDSSFFWNDTAPTTSVFSIGTGAAVNTLNENYVFYTFRSVPGVCKVGSYVGNNTDDNAYISLGFKPRFFMCKMITSSSQWHLIDSARSPINEGQIQSFANLANAEQNSTVGAYDLLSDGIKIRSDAGFEPGNTGTWLYMAMADIGGNGRLPPIYGR